MRKLTLAFVLLAAGCGGSGSTVPGDAGGPVAANDGGDGGPVNAGGCGAPTPGASAVCASYAPSSIAGMRGSPAPGCFELAHVGLVARTDSPTQPRLYVQDATDTDLAAIVAKCSATAQHRCSPAVVAKIPLLHDTATEGAKLTLRGYFDYGKVTSFEEFYIEDIIDECSTVPRPAPIALTVADVTRDARSRTKWFRRATIDVPATDPLVVYDMSPAELALPKGACPNWEGFAMIPTSAGASAAAACGGAVNPASRTADAREILIGRQFFNQFLFSTDCSCAAASKQRLVTPTNTVSGSLLGYLLLEHDAASTASYQVFEPAADKSFPIK
jgi:hypothetical protein